MMDKDESRIYSGNYILTSTTIVLIVFFIFICLIIHQSISLGNNRYWVSILSFAFIFAFFTYRMNYFILTDKKLIVKNPIWYSKLIEFDLNTIKEITFIQPFRSPKSLYIHTQNEKQLIRASSLRDKTWKRLKQDLENKNILIHDKIGLN
ncbi:hypothetical protein [Flavobacterium ginsengiterrae]|uniref:PH (Pleckstrin Homology) domain-containing protein n=1 Tax=Flavobacterium ginsengiterrae TaxID=871695 RepID=A0ABP7GW47_9FLAO